MSKTAINLYHNARNLQRTSNDAQVKRLASNAKAKALNAIFFGD